MTAQHLFGTFQVVRCVNADGLYIRQTHLDAIAIIQPAQLFQARWVLVEDA